jgi:hypothetical protein
VGVGALDSLLETPAFLDMYEQVMRMMVAYLATRYSLHTIY